MLDGIWFVLAGMAVVFASLALLMVAMMILNRWPTKPAAGGTDAASSETSSNP